MKAIIIAFFVLSFFGGAVAEDIADGIYLRSTAETPQSLLSDRGRKIFLGEKRTFEWKSRSFNSQNNENTDFNLSLSVPFDEAMKSSSFVLVIDGKVYHQSGSGSSGKESSSFDFLISGDENAKAVSTSLNLPITYRRHPGHKFLVSFVSSKKKFGVGEKVTAKLRIQNVGSNTVSFWDGGYDRGPRNNQFIFSAFRNFKPVEDMGSSFNGGGFTHLQKLKPEAIFEKEVCLSDWFAFDEPGIYDVHGAFILRFIDPDSEKLGLIWEDYAAADFYVVIQDADKGR